MLLPRFDPPANIGDFTTEAQRNNWSKLISGFFKADIQEVDSFPGVTSQFYDPTITDTDPVNQEALISWPGFPRLVLSAHPGNKPAAWAQAEGAVGARAQFQDE